MMLQISYKVSGIDKKKTLDLFLRRLLVLRCSFRLRVDIADILMNVSTALNHT